MVGIDSGQPSSSRPLLSSSKALRKKGRIMDSLGGQDVVLKIDPHTEMLTATDHKGKKIPVTVTYWFVWKDIHPDSRRYDF